MRAFGLSVAILLWASSASATEVSGSAGLVSDYRYRGISLSNGRPAAQAFLNLEHDSGLYAGLWASTLGSGAIRESEVDFTAGFSRTIGESVTIDLSGSYFSYPAAGAGNYFETRASATLSGGGASAKVGISFVPAQSATRGEDGRRRSNLYLFGTADYAVPATPLTLSAGLGFERGAFDEVENGGKWDWSLGAEAAIEPARLGLAWVGSNTGGGDRRALVASFLLDW